MFRHFIQRWNAVKEEKLKQNPHYPLLVPKVNFSNCDESFLFFLLVDPIFTVLGLGKKHAIWKPPGLSVHESTWHFELVW
jgi:hypothetical protein